NTGVPDTTPVSGSAPSANPPNPWTTCRIRPSMPNNTCVTSRSGANPNSAAPPRLVHDAVDSPASLKCWYAPRHNSATSSSAAWSSTRLAMDASDRRGCGTCPTACNCATASWFITRHSIRMGPITMRAPGDPVKYGGPRRGPPARFSAAGDDRQLHEARVSRLVEHALLRFSVVAGLGPEDVGHEGLRIPVIEREPARLDLDHDAVPRQKDMVRGGQIELVEQRLVGRNRFGRFEALAIPAAEDVHGDRQLVAAHGRVVAHLVRVDIDHLHHPVGVGARRRGDKVGDRLAADLDGLR